MALWIWSCLLLVGLLLLVVLHDVSQKRSAILRNFPVIGHIRYFLIEIGPEIRQYLVAHNREEQPFNRSERDWIYNSADRKNNYSGFGTDDQIYGIGYPIIKHAVIPYGNVAFRGSKHDKTVQIPCAKVIGARHKRQKAWRPPSIINISAMSYGSLGKNAITSLNLGAKAAGCFHNTGEGGASAVSPARRRRVLADRHGLLRRARPRRHLLAPEAGREGHHATRRSS